MGRDNRHAGKQPCSHTKLEIVGSHSAQTKTLLQEDVMKQFILIEIFVIIHSTVFSQEYISGKVVDEDGEPMLGVPICIEKSKNCCVSDIDGEFSILKPKKKGMTLLTSFIGYETVKIHDIDTIFHPVTITMQAEHVPLINGNKYNLVTPFGISLRFDYLAPSFKEFESILGKGNVDNLNKLKLILGGEFAACYKEMHLALNIGLDGFSTLGYDSISSGKGEYKTFLLGTHFGYKIINSKVFIVTPEIGFKLYRYRMFNYDNNYHIPIEQYIIDRDLDIRFNNFIGSVGIDCCIFLLNDYYGSIAIGLYGGYAFKLDDKTFVYSRRNRLFTNHKVDINHFNFGIIFSYIFNW